MNEPNSKFKQKVIDLFSRKFANVDLSNDSIFFYLPAKSIQYACFVYCVDSALVIHVISGITIKEEKRVEIALLLNAINDRAPFGCFQFRRDNGAVIQRLNFFPSIDSEVFEDAIDKALSWGVYNIQLYGPAIESVALGFAELISVINKVDHLSIK